MNLVAVIVYFYFVCFCAVGLFTVVVVYFEV